jgi:site-specific DNA recombinase
LKKKLYNNNNEDNIKNVAIYTRVSTEDQAREGFSLDSQLERLKAFCFSRDWNVYKTYVDDGYSGRNIKRPKYQEMFNDIQYWDAIVVIKMDRIHRNSMNFYKMMADLKKVDKNFVSMTESFDSSNAMGRFFMDMTQRIAQLESEQIGERTFIAMYQKAKDTKSGWMGHWIPYGYKGKHILIEERLSNGKRKTRTILEPDPEKINVVKQIFELADKDISISKITKLLDLKYSRVHYIIHNPFYAGLERWTNKLKKAPVEPIITRELFNRIQIKISKKFLSSNYSKDKNIIEGRSRPLQLPLDDVEVFEIPKEDLKEISSIRFDRFKHPMGV